MTEHVKDNDYATLYYDKDRFLIGVEFHKDKRDESYKLRKYRNGKLGYVTAIAFLKFYGVTYKSKSLTYTVVWDKKENMIVLDLKEHQKKKPASKQLLGQEDPY